MSSWTSDFGADSFALRAALALGALALLVTLGLTLQVLLLRALSARRQAAQQAAVERWRPLLLRAAAGDSMPLPPVLTTRERVPVLLLWNRLQDGLRGRSHDGLNALAAQLGLPALARRYARRRHGRRRLIGLRTLGHLGQMQDWERLIALLEHPRSQVSLAAARALLRVNAQRAAPFVIDQFLARTDWPVPQVGTLLREAGADSIGFALAERLLEAPPAQQLRLLPLARLTEAPGRGSVVDAVLEISTEPAVLSATLQLVHGPGVRPRVEVLCSHPDWQVRSYAALALGRLGDAGDRKLLISMLSDREWWVRYRAAQSLLQLPGFDEVAALALRRALTDRFARDMMSQVMAERRLAGAA